VRSDIPNAEKEETRPQRARKESFKTRRKKSLTIYTASISELGRPKRKEKSRVLKGDLLFHYEGKEKRVGDRIAGCRAISFSNALMDRKKKEKLRFPSEEARGKRPGVTRKQFSRQKKGEIRSFNCFRSHRKGKEKKQIIGSRFASEEKKRTDGASFSRKEKSARGRDDIGILFRDGKKRGGDWLGGSSKGALRPKGKKQEQEHIGSQPFTTALR